MNSRLSVTLATSQPFAIHFVVIIIVINIVVVVVVIVEQIAINRTGWLSIEQIGYRSNRLAINKTDWLSIDSVGYQ